MNTGRNVPRARSREPYERTVTTRQPSSHEHVLLVMKRPDGIIICQALQAPVDHFIAPESPAWATHVLRTLSLLQDSGDDEDRYALRFHSVCSNGSNGPSQQMHSADASLILAAL